MLEASQTTIERPAGLERRLVFRLLSHWRDLAGDTGFPSFSHVDPFAIPDIWPFCFALDTTEFPDDPIVRIAQPGVCGDSSNIINRHISALPPATLIIHSCSYVDEVLRKSVPISRGGDFIRGDGVRILYRSILLPMSDDGKTICGIWGGANCREVKAV